MGSLKHKRSKTVGRVPTSVAEGEIALNLKDGLIFTHDGEEVIQLDTDYPRVKRWHSGMSNYGGGIFFEGTNGKLYFGSSNHGTCQYPGSHWNDATNLGIIEVCLPYHIHGAIKDFGVIGNHSMYVLFESGHLYGWGQNDSGELFGRSPVNENVRKPTLIRTGIVEVAPPLNCGNEGNYPTVYWKNDRHHWHMSGHNEGSARCGKSGQAAVIEAQTYIVPIPGAGSSRIEKIWNFGCRYGATFAQTFDGKLWAIGYNGQGQLGVGNTTTWITTWTEVKGLPTGYKIKDVAGAYGSRNHSNNVWQSHAQGFTYIALTDGRLYSTGINEFGQLGSKNNTNRSSFALASNMHSGNVKKMVTYGSGRYGGIYVLSENGTLRYAGYNGTGQAGNGNTTNDPKLVYTLSTTATDVWTTKGGHVASHFSHVFYIQAGTLIGHGANDTGCIAPERAHYNYATSKSPSLFGWVGTDNIREMIPVNGATGNDNGLTFMITKDGRLYGAGYNGVGVLKGWYHRGQVSDGRYEMPMRLV
ncbi:hypothetical protein [Vibrio sp. ER1A]|uniref:hypothetical protein n=1 Tax=Vibrio sp. ER1A TaxID=1517681 RepID=UPI0004DD3D10|nr:hypothetical protein [Vibrio sp. ER1A]KFA97565.1 hypothetical protein HW45_09155 [Vibrio sp. ER1A]